MKTIRADDPATVGALNCRELPNHFSRLSIAAEEC
jgi:hypothetical protein